MSATYLHTDGEYRELSNPIFMPNDGELMAARGAIVSYIDSIAHGNLTATTEVLDTIIKAVILSLQWQPPVVVGTTGGKT